MEMGCKPYRSAISFRMYYLNFHFNLSKVPKLNLNNLTHKQYGQDSDTMQCSTGSSPSISIDSYGSYNERQGVG